MKKVALLLTPLSLLLLLLLLAIASSSEVLPENAGNADQETAGDLHAPASSAPHADASSDSGTRESVSAGEVSTQNTGEGVGEQVSVRDELLRTCVEHYTIFDCTAFGDFVEFATCQAHLSEEVTCESNDYDAVGSGPETDSVEDEQHTHDRKMEQEAAAAAVSELEFELEDVEQRILAPAEFKKLTEAAKKKVVETPVHTNTGDNEDDGTVVAPLPTVHVEDEEEVPVQLEFNYADQYNGAKLLESNQEATGAQHILHGDMDKYVVFCC